MKNITEMTRKDFDAVPSRDWNEDIGEFDSLVIIPLGIMHDSGYRCLDFVACENNKPIKRLSGCSDVVHLDGIGGYGKNWLEQFETVPSTIPIKAWSIDCLPKSGYLRLFCKGKLTADPALSSFCLYAKRK